jgi:large subunit ribosomal protein L23
MAILDILKSDDSEKKLVTAKSLKAKKVAGEKSDVAASLHAVIKHPRITEKAAVLSGSNIYTFEVAKDATKIEIAKAIKAIYKVVPRKVAIIIVPAKRKIVRGKRGVIGSVKKALVYLKKGETIDFM